MEINYCVDRICSGKFDFSHVITMLIYLRWEKQTSPLIKDLANFAAHYNKRNQGLTFDTISNYICNVLNDIEKNKELNARKYQDILLNVFNPELVIHQLMISLKSALIQFNESTFINNGEKLIECIKKIIHSVPIKCAFNQINSCSLILDDGGTLWLKFSIIVSKTSLVDHVINTSGNGKEILVVLSQPLLGRFESKPKLEIDFM